MKSNFTPGQTILNTKETFSCSGLSTSTNRNKHLDLNGLSQRALFPTIKHFVYYYWTENSIRSR